ncbi:hypothetical protein SERLA73DRAFT_179725 [Serpula lacrymans var. lacrymans S7.3]|uniref:Distal membrane-arm assembly complex protein 1-like domain-containing protein n=1 Tax=Serpula lacrymans var. lacrymans (strain S7.3) TaxID=936435 RepID=F8PTZ6_SERL3|nr:hypothetical protein SERLA73DRAFT_179725 [Serpula lacrymans var. lacrymans S7.3]
MNSSSSENVSSTKAARHEKSEQPAPAYKDCLSCRIVGTGALAGTGLYALNMSRARAPGSVMGKRVMAGVGVGFLIGSALRWTT